MPQAQPILAKQSTNTIIEEPEEAESSVLTAATTKPQMSQGAFMLQK